ncbi:MAG: N-methyl-L-tryptophan oxidase [Pirellulales bacterium]
MYDAIVLGTGGVGSAALYHAARRGLRVLGLDRFEPGHDRGSSHGDTRIIRMAYYEHPDYVPLLRRAYQLWSQLENETGERLYEEVGLLEVGAEDGELIPGVLRCAAEHGLELERLEAADVARRFRGFRCPDGCAAVFERQAGFLHVERCVRTHLKAAVARGAEHRWGVELRGWRRCGENLEVATSAGTVAARRIILAPGAWASQLLSDIDVPWRVLLKHLYWLEPRDDAYRAVEGGSAFFFDLPWGMFYGFPQIDAQGVKLGEHSGGRPIADPLVADRSPSSIDFARVEAFASECMPSLTNRLQRQSTCFYTMTPDAHFVIDQHPADPSVVYAAGLSGHGFKFTSALGELLVAWSLDGAPNLPVDFLSARRFATPR